MLYLSAETNTGTHFCKFLSPEVGATWGRVRSEHGAGGIMSAALLLLLLLLALAVCSSYGKPVTPQRNLAGTAAARYRCI
ncbi:hypothetical protein RR46_12265 [Papilio xuthus]|uniref:Uncharacterized protein n=1 Tax=Papilio xuthus TaxID=66420 RepID=A0A194PYK6_PAPXU|nr:hypothetical protein RR46_12265 [Papilio xuthus]